MRLYNMATLVLIHCLRYPFFAIGMEDEICPYATFHLLGFREEMDPTKAMNFQTFPHQNGMGGPGHMGTMGSSMAMQVPSHVHSRSGSQSMVMMGLPDLTSPLVIQRRLALRE